MSRTLLRLVVVLLAILASLSNLLAADGPRPDRTVILVSIDGLANFYLDDPRAEMPTIRQLAREGARADGMVTSFPSVTWCAHATLATGQWPSKHGVLANDYFDRQSKQKVTLLCDPVFDKDQIVRVPTVYDVAHQAGLITASVVWPATRNAKTLTFSAPDMPGDEAWTQFGTPAWISELRQAGLPVDSHGKWCREATGGAPRDWLYTRMVRRLLQKHQPNLILVHLVEPDHVQHRTGPRSADAYWCASYSDDRIRDILEAVRESPRAQNTFLIVCSDHGFFPFDKVIQPNVLFRQLGFVKLVNGQPAEQKVWAIAQGGSAAVYVLDSANRSSIVSKLAAEFKQVEGIAAVLTGPAIKELGQSTAEEDPRCPDLWLAAKKGYSFGETASGEQVVVSRSGIGGSHGYLPDDPDMLAMCVIWGPGIAAGTQLGKIQTVDIAPTAATILGLTLPASDGRSLVKP